MCGIVGYIGEYSKDRFAMFEDMLRVDVLRGADSTGVAFINNKDVTIVKDTLLPDHLMFTDEYVEAAKRQRHCYIGHNRFATKGKVSKENAHPFKAGEIYLVHNGTLHTTWQMPDDLKYDTDSECIANAIANYGIKETWRALNGAATLVWYDNNEKTLNIATNGKRPFSAMFLKDYSGLAFASERWMITAPAVRNRVELHDMSKVLVPADDTHYRITWNSKRKRVSVTEEKLEPFKWGNKMPGVKEPYVWRAKESHSFRHSPKQLSWLTPNHSTSTSNNDDHFGPFGDIEDAYPAWKQAGLKKPETKGEVIPFVGKTASERPGEHIEGEEIDFAEMNRKSFTLAWFLDQYHECASCREPLTTDDFQTSKVLDDNTAICEMCQKDILMNSGLMPNQIRMH